MITENSLVKFKHLKNSRGYPLCGRVIDTDGEYAIVEAFGYEGTGTKTEINDVPVTELESEEQSCTQE